MHRPNDERNQAIPPQPACQPQLHPSQRGLKFQLAALTLVFVSALGVTGLAYWLKSPNKPESEGKGFPARLFQGWGKPDLVVVLSAQQHGYMLPCGCSEPQVGGLERRYNFIQRLKAQGWPVVAVDLGDVIQKTAPANLPNVQGLIKYRYSMMALKEMGYLAVGIGANETCGSFSLASVEGEWAASFGQPIVLAGNLKDADSKFLFLKPLETRTVPIANIKLGVTSIVGPTVAARVKDPSVRFNPSLPSIEAQLRKMHQEKVDLPILFYHGLATGNKAEAIACAKYFPDFPIILALCEEEEPPAHPIAVEHPDKGGTPNYVFRLGHKGKYIGVLGVYRNGASFHFKYQLVEMSPEYRTPAQEEDAQPIRRMMEDYTRELKHKDILKDYTQNPSLHSLQAMDAVPDLRNPGNGVPTYIGSQACGKCHEHAYEVWKASKHSHAYKSLVEAKHPSLRQYDGECIVCHTVGFGYKTGFTNEKDTPLLENVGCESCHGPGSLHARNPENQQWRERMNMPWLDARKKGNVPAKNLAIEKFCVTCHDIDNDVTWVHGIHNKKDPFVEKWEKRKIIHNNPPE
ncbi:MAG: multiheme c-type cytochrome [Gemmataceae bacterium]